MNFQDQMLVHQQGKLETMLWMIVIRSTLEEGTISNLCVCARVCNEFIIYIIFYCCSVNALQELIQKQSLHRQQELDVQELVP